MDLLFCFFSFAAKHNVKPFEASTPVTGLNGNRHTFKMNIFDIIASYLLPIYLKLPEDF